MKKGLSLLLALMVFMTFMPVISLTLADDDVEKPSVVPPVIEQVAEQGERYYLWIFRNHHKTSVLRLIFFRNSHNTS